MYFENEYNMSVNELLNKYFEGETSAAEEQELRVFFNSQEVPENLKSYKPFFAYISEEIEKQKIPEKTEMKRIAFTKRKIIYYISTAAACTIIFLAIGLLNRPKKLPCIADGSYVIINGQCYSDVEMVKSMAFQALMEVSVPVEDYMPEKEIIHQKEIMNSQLKELSNIFTE